MFFAFFARLLVVRWSGSRRTMLAQNSPSAANFNSPTANQIACQKLYRDNLITLSV
jgi:hypothetical protein